MKKIKALSIFRSNLLDNRGTPLRVKSLITFGKTQEAFEWYTCSLDTESPLGLPHCTINHHHYHDIRTIVSFVKKHDIEVLIVHSLSAAFYMPFLRVFLPKHKMVLEMHGFREEEEFLYGAISRPRYYLDKFLHSFIYRMSHLITTCSISATEYLYPYNKNVVSVYGGFDQRLFDPNTPSGGYIKRGASDLVIGYAGDGKKWQGLPFLLSTFERVVETYPQCKLALLLSEKRTIPDRPYIQVTDALPHEKVSGFTVDCDVLVIPRIKSRVNELTYPSKFMEYLAMGKPVIVSRTSDMHKIIRDGENGMLYDPEDAQGFIDAVGRLTDPVVRARVGANARKTAVEGYTWDIQGKIFTGAIAQLCK